MSEKLLKRSRGRGKGRKEDEDKYVQVLLQCEGEGCTVWQEVRVPENWDADKVGRFFCGICLGEELEKLRRENKKLREQLGRKAEEEAVEKELDKFQGKMRDTLAKLEREKEEVVRQTSEKVATYAQAVNNVERNMQEVKAEAIAAANSVVKGDSWRKEVKDAVRDNVFEERRKRRIIVFGLKDNKRDEEDVGDILMEIGVKCRLLMVERMMRRENQEGCRPVIVEVASERDRMDIMFKKGKLRNTAWREVFLGMDLNREQREMKKKQAAARRAQKAEEKQKKGETSEGERTLRKEVEVGEGTAAPIEREREETAREGGNKEHPGNQ